MWTCVRSEGCDWLLGGKARWSGSGVMGTEGQRGGAPRAAIGRPSRKSSALWVEDRPNRSSTLRGTWQLFIYTIFIYRIHYSFFYVYYPISKAYG